jgi:hypothetical protein
VEDGTENHLKIADRFVRFLFTYPPILPIVFGAHRRGLSHYWLITIGAFGGLKTVIIADN